MDGPAFVAPSPVGICTKSRVIPRRSIIKEIAGERLAFSIACTTEGRKHCSVLDIELSHLQSNRTVLVKVVHSRIRPHWIDRTPVDVERGAARTRTWRIASPIRTAVNDLTEAKVTPNLAAIGVEHVAIAGPI